jgi:hypothetical protein
MPVEVMEWLKRRKGRRCQFWYDQYTKRWSVKLSVHVADSSHENFAETHTGNELSKTATAALKQLKGYLS